MIKSFKRISSAKSQPKADTAVWVGRMPARIVPRAAGWVADSRCRLIPGPQFNHRMNLHIQMEYTSNCKVTSNLLPGRTFDFRKVMKILFGRRTIGNCFKNVLLTGQEIGTHKGSPAIRVQVKGGRPFWDDFYTLFKDKLSVIILFFGTLLKKDFSFDGKRTVAEKMVISSR